MSVKISSQARPSNRVTEQPRTNRNATLVTQYGRATGHLSFANNEWETSATKSSLVSIGTHQLFASVSGPVRTPGEPIVIIFAGSGEASSSYPALERLVSKFARILLYDRSGLGRSEDGPNRVSATTAAEELHSLLKATGIAAPYILVGHSYGGIVAREYLHLNPDDVAGMVLAESSTERQCQFFRIPDPNILAVMGDLKFSEITELRSRSQLTRDEWRTRAAETARGVKAQQAEAAAFAENCEALAQKDQYNKQALGTRPLSVIRCRSSRDYERIYESGIRAGNGTEEQRKAFRHLLDQWDNINEDLQGEQLKLSSQSRLVDIPDCGHNVNLVRPDVMAEEIRWVIQSVRNQHKTDNRL
ncbi:Alpha/beta hydrolase fold protein [Rasamsonia emersonii CBS 393.64]|uniref:Alpha/beta hydrolase fold protein n=1 Tax=Rasamsonia emersonii (strain ATCC 16479 / CBS 393.64 / IMI 116815) TaxID=1408163 RepID=A0A0F4Z4G9_RASE3|nr:Alpha/beta hydrolase fold protein [Rasamsonia emersonii CBS 393.64]KKA25412.1 Alpha/beta hydrolase fold protein [Rasamsonia emersonii CBS 393.64]